MYLAKNLILEGATFFVGSINYLNFCENYNTFNFFMPPCLK